MKRFDEGADRPAVWKGLQLPLLLAAAALLGASGLATVAATPLYFVEDEEFANATVARELLRGGDVDLLEFQHTPYCGGCTAVSLVAAGTFAIAGVHYLAWKAVPASLAAAMLLLGFAFLRRTSGTAAGWIWVLLWIGAPAVLAQSTLMAWGNHYEVTALVLLQGIAAAALLGPATGPPGQRRLPWLVLGLMAGAGFWFCYSSAFALPALALVVALAVRPGLTATRVPYLLAGLAAGLVPLAVYSAAGEGDPFLVLTVSPTDQGSGFLRQVGAVTLARYATSLHFVPSGGMPRWWSVLTLGALWAAVAVGGVAALRVRGPRRPAALLPAVLVAGAAGLYLVSPFEVDVSGGGAAPTPMEVRYLVPTMILALVLAAAGIGRLWTAARWGRLAAGALLLAIALPGAWTRLAWIGESHADHCAATTADIPPFQYRMLVDDKGRHMPEDAWLRRSPEDWISRVNHRRALGVRRARGFLDTPPAAAPDLLAEVAALPGMAADDLPMLLHGLGRELASLSEYEDVSPERYLPAVAALLEATDGPGRDALAAGIWAHGAEMYARMERPLPATATDLPDALAWPLSAADCALCPVLGLVVARPRPPADVKSPGEVVLGGESLLAGSADSRRALLVGVGAAYGQQLGHCPDAVEEMAARFAPEDGRAVLDGFAVGRAPRWVVAVPIGTPPERVP